MAKAAKAAKSVSWAPGLKLCQVRLFLSEDAPVLSGSDGQDHLQAKTARLWHSTVSGADESLPPGFELFNPNNLFKIDFSQIPLVQWKHPLQFDLNPDWLLVAGEESLELQFQNRRQMGALEAIYPRASSIPPNPSFSPDALDSYYDDACTLIVPITPIEDEDSDSADPILPPDATVARNFPGHAAVPARYEVQQLQGNNMATLCKPSAGTQTTISMPGVEPDVAAAATLAFTAIMNSAGKDSLVDRELLIKILSDPKLVEKLASEYGAPVQGSVPVAAPSSHSTPMPITSTTLVPTSNFSVPPPTSQPVGHFVATSSLNHPPVAEVPSGVNPNGANAVRSSGMRDMTYYKSLIEQHGDEKRGMWDPSQPPQFANYDERSMQGLKQRDPNPRVPKPCVFFNSPRGCKHGTSCLFLHDAAPLSQAVERRNPKRIKLDGEITGRN